MKTTIPEIAKRKGGEKITVLSIYDYTSAKLTDGLVDIFLVGDSLGMGVYGFDSTLPVTLEMMINHGRAVAKAGKETMTVVDMPFNSYQQSTAQAFDSAARLMAETGCQAVKIEGGAEMAETIKYLTERGIPVMGHIGLQPQYFNAYGGFKIQGKTADSAKEILNAAKAVEDAGCFSIVLEGVKKDVADKVVAATKIPIIGIGASANCDGQVLVLNDLLGMNENVAKFVKTYADLKKVVPAAVKEFAKEIKSGKFPSDKNTY